MNAYPMTSCDWNLKQSLGLTPRKTDYQKSPGGLISYTRSQALDSLLLISDFRERLQRIELHVCVLLSSLKLRLGWQDTDLTLKGSFPLLASLLLYTYRLFRKFEPPPNHRVGVMQRSPPSAVWCSDKYTVSNQIYDVKSGSVLNRISIIINQDATLKF